MLAVAMSLLLGVEGQVLSRCDQGQSSALEQEARRDMSAKNFETAALKFQEAILACADDRNLLIERANALFMALRLTEARSAASEALRGDPTNAAALKIKGNAEYLLGYIQQSMNTFISLLDRHPEDEEGAYMLGRIYYQEGRIDQAIGQFERVLRINPNSYRTWDNLGLCWEANGDNEKAIAHFLHAIKLVEKDHPEYDWAYANLADLLVKTGDAEHAFAAAAKAANSNPMSARNFYIGAKALERLGKTELCLNWSQRAAALDPNYSEPQYLLSRIYHRLGQEDKAEEARRRFQELKAKEPSQRR
jgi:tetratricopeptide (TPR) repeat protein